jgi:glycosyltransferase involved in cell wall biosynthesis
MTPHVCFIKAGVYGVITGEEAGGAEREIYLLAKEFKRRGFEVTIITGREGQEMPDAIEGINLIKGPTSKNSKLLYPLKAISYFRCMKQADADIYFLLGGIWISMILNIYSLLLKSNSIYRVISDKDIKFNNGNVFTRLKFSLYIQSLKMMDLVVTQTIEQKETLAEQHNLKSKVIPGGYTLPDEEEMINPEDREYFLWVGRLTENKQPEVFAHIARQLPSIKFVMIGPIEDQVYDGVFEEVEAELNNFEYLGFVASQRTDEFFREAIALVNTSSVEGFPNTFLEAWRYGTPVVSLNHTVDGLLKNENCGLYASASKTELANAVRRLYDNEDLLERLAKNARAHMKQKHSNQKVVDEYVRKLKNLE